MSTHNLLRVSMYHNILWAKYKGVVFSRVHSNGNSRGIDTAFIQIAETENQRVGLGLVDLSYHNYPYRLLFPGAFESVPLHRRVIALLADLIRNPCDLVVMPGYDRLEYWAMLTACILLRRKRAVFCDSTTYDQPKYRWKEIAKRLFFRRCDGFFCYGIRSKKYIVSYGVDESRIKYRIQAAALPHDYDASKILEFYTANRMETSAIPRFLYIGRLSEEKGLIDLLGAFRCVRETIPEARLDCVGAGPLKDQLIDRVRELGLESVVAFLGTKSIEEIAPLLMNSAAMVLPSHSEPWGLVVNEALSYGCPVVVSDVCGCVPEMVLNGVTGYSFPVGNVHALCEAMISAARMSTDRSAVAKKCLDLIAQYTPEQAAAQILDGCVQIMEVPS
jgi:glycosyltransferase involved in cell wall biosynthesis